MIEFTTGERVLTAETLADLLAEIERSLLLGVLKAKKGNITHTAEILGMTTSGLYRKLRRYEITMEVRQ